MRTKNLLLNHHRMESKIKPIRRTSDAYMRQREVLMLDHLLCNLQVDNKTNVPIIKSYDVEDTLPKQMIAFHEAINASRTDFDAIVHFYVSDENFIRLFRNPTKYVSTLRKYKYVISPDMSQYIEMPYFSRFANNCYNKSMAQYLQLQGVNIIANVTWSLPDSYEFSFSGIPCHTTIAINSNGVNNSIDSKYLWHRGYEEALNRLQPKRIIRYGQKMPNENEDISIYFDNTYLRRMRHGR